MRRIKSVRNSPVWEKMTSHLCKYDIFTHSLGYLTLNENVCEVTLVQHKELN